MTKDSPAINVKDVKKNFTSEVIATYKCKAGKSQSIFWDAKTTGLGLRVTSSGAKSYVFETSLNNKTIRTTIGDVSTYSIKAAQTEATRLKSMTDKGVDPRQVKADQIASDLAKVQAKKDKDATTALQQKMESVTVGEAWLVYVKERSASKIDGKLEWGDRHKEHLASFVQAGGVKRKRGSRPNQPNITREGILYPLMNMRLVDLDSKAVSTWLDKEIAKAPTSTAKAFSALRAFLTWCSKKDDYSAVTHSQACKSDEVKNKVPSSKIKENDSLRRAYIKPWFESVQKIGNPIISAYLQGLLLTGARRNELAGLRWQDVDFKGKSISIRDKVEGERTIPLTPYMEYLINPLARRNEFVFSSLTSKSKRIEEPRIPHKKALTIAGLPNLSLHGLRRSFATLAEWVEVPAGIVAQIMGHKPSAIAEKHYIQRELDLLHLWHVRIEAWILEEAEIKYEPVEAGLQVVKTA